jgi:hypothetical protein
MSAVQELKQLHEAGFSDDELGQWALGRRKALSEAGFRNDEIDTYFGHPPFDPKPLVDQFNTSLEQATAPSGEGGRPIPVTNFMDALKAGWGESITGLLQERPQITVAPDAPMASRIAGQVGTLAGDVPAMIAGYLAGGANPITGMAGAFALPAGVRKVLMDKYEKGEVDSFQDFWERASGAFIDTAKGWITGAATGAVGKVVGMAPIQSPTLKATAVGASEIATMVTVGKALEGQVPQPHEFLDAAVTLGFVKGSAKVAGKLRTIYAEHGIKPQDVLQDIEKDPTIAQDLASDRIAIPRAYQDAAADAAAQARRGEVPKPQPTGEYVETPPTLPSILELAKQMQASVEKTSETGAFFEPGQPPVARVTPPYEARPAPTPTAKDLVTGKAELDRAREAETSVFEKSRALRTAEEILQERNLLRTAEDMIVRKERPVLREKKYIPPRPKQSPEEMMVDSTGRTMTTGEYLAKELEKEGIVFGEKGEATWEKSILPNDAQKAILDRIVQHEPGSEGLSFRALYTAALDNLNPIRMALRDVGKEKEPTAENAYSLERLTRGTMGKGTQFIKRGAFDFNTYETVTKGYEEILAPVKKDLDGFRAYIASKRVIEKSEQGIETGFDVAQARAVVKAGAAKYQKVHEERLKYRDAMVQYLVDSGILSNEKAFAIREANKDYVPFYRFFEDAAARPSGAAGVKQPIKKMEGGTAKILDPIMSDIKDTFLFIGLAEKNAARQAYVKHPELAEKVKTKQDVLSKKELQEIIDEHGVSEDTAQKISALRPANFRASQNEIAVFEKGERHVYKVDPKVAEAFQDLDRISTNMLTDMLLHTPANLLRAGVIVTPEYISRNIIRDAVSAFVYAGSNPVKTIKGAVSIARKDEAYQNWLKGGGANATMVAIDRDYIQSHIMDLNLETGAFQRAWNVARTPLDVLRAASEFVENSTRLGSVRSEMQQAKDKAAIQALSLIARESTVDFARHGKNLQEFGKMTAFFNPTLQGIDRFARSLHDAPLATTAKSLGSITLPALLLWWANKDDEEIHNLPAWQQYTMLMARVPLPNGGSFILRVPLAHELGVLFATLPTRLLDQFVKDNPDAMRDLDKTLLAAFAPSFVPTAIAPMLAQGMNTNVLSGGPLIPAYQEKLLPEYQYTPYTTELTKALGSKIGAFPGMETLSLDRGPFGGTARALTSPTLIENYVRAWTGGMGMYLLQLADKGLREAHVLPDPVKPAWTLADIPVVRAFVARYPSASAQSIQTFYEDADKSKIRYNTFLELAKNGDPKAADFLASHRADMAQLDAFTETISQQARLIRMIHKNPSIAPDEKRQLIDTTYFRMIELSRAGNAVAARMKELNR